MDVTNSMPVGAAADKHKPLVSVVMPTYNAEKYIKEAIESVLSQTVSDIELLVIDDCSKDATAEIVREFAARDPRVKLLVNEKNLGAGHTRNQGLAIFEGRHISFLDSDDYWDPCLLEKMLARREECGADIVYCSYSIVDENGRKLCNDFIVPEETDFEKSLVRSVITCSTVLIDGELGRKISFPTNVYHEDIALWFRLLRDGAKACGVTEILACYRQHEGSRSSSKLASAYRRWPIYRKYLGFSVMQSAVYMIKYAYYGLIKYKKLA